MPDGHIDRDVQILVHNRLVTVDVRMAASDVTWIEIIRLAAERTKPEGLKTNGLQPFYSTGLSRAAGDETPFPTKAEDVAAWLLHGPNRRLLEQWVASCCRLEWRASETAMLAKPDSRPDSRHHWSITFQMKFRLADEGDVGPLKWRQDPFVAYPGKVRRAIKTRGESLIDSTDVSPLVVRAEHEIRDEESTAEQRTEAIEAALRLPSVD
jgi:hypothetical protein